MTIRPDTKNRIFLVVRPWVAGGCKKWRIFWERPRGRGENNYFTLHSRPKAAGETFVFLRRINGFSCT